MGINNTLKTLKVKMDDSFSKHAADSRAEYIKQLPAGSPIPKANKIYGSEYLDAFRKEAEDIRSQAMSAITEERERLSKQQTAAPSDEAVRAISLLKLRTNLTPDDINNMLAAYGSNYSAHKAIVSVASDAGVKYDFPTHEIDRAVDGLDFVSSKVPSMFSAMTYEKNGVQPMTTLGFSHTLDSELPE